MELSVLNASGSQVSTVEASDAIFGVEVNPSVIHSVVRWQRAKRRAGTHSTLNLGRMKGGGKKPFKQKGLGRARAGTRNSPLWRGGAVIFGPQPRDYSYRMPRKVKRLALFGVLSAKVTEDALVIVDKVDFSAPKTKDFQTLLSGVNLVSDKTLYVFSEGEEAAAVSARNIINISCLPVVGANVYDLLNAKKLLMSEKTFNELQQILTARLDENDASGEQFDEEEAA